MTPTFAVLAYGMASALATALGALPFALVRRLSPRVVAASNAIASGLMLGACFGLVAEGTVLGAWQTGLGGLLGVAFIMATERWLASHDVEFGEVRGAGARRMILIVIVMTVHSIAEGVAIGAAFAGGVTLAMMITAAIAVHNVPEGLAISSVLRPQGASLVACAWWSLFSSLPQPLVAVPAFLFVDAFAPALPWSLGFAAGAMVFMVLVELLPEAYEEGRRGTISLLVSLSIIAMVAFQRLL
jgi:zinc transporter ZupT